MAYQCPKCQAQYDVTLFQFGKKVVCNCGEIIDATKARVIKKEEVVCAESTDEKETGGSKKRK